ncbi:MAG: dihydropteroate synthase [Lachnospiraceae bacterium]|nr:dihydropteroate synthase [Lachnospiraceae bacterium]MBR6303014.1 dihydropteroate synthase [Lachnospiraceae bacterium]
MIIADREFCKDDRFYIFGILNVTPDSFSDGGRFIIDGKVNKDRVLPTVEKMIGEGMDIVDVGGESTRPGYTLISDEEEIERTAPVIEAIKKNFDIPISLDTYKGAVAKAGIEAGADLINDIWGFKYSPDMADIVAKAGVSCCLMQNRKDTNYVNFTEDVVSDLRESVEIAVKAGISRDRIMVDPGVGFAKSYEQNLEIINKLNELCKLELPILLGTSRKSVIGLTLDLPSSERVEGTVATSVIGALKGARFFRVHDIKENRRALDMTRAILSQGV